MGARRFWQNSLFGGLPRLGNKHVRSGAVAQWRREFTPALAKAFLQRFPGLLQSLGYETSDDWALDLQDGPVTGMLSDFRQLAAQRWESFAGAGAKSAEVLMTTRRSFQLSPHLQALEDEAVYVLREAAAEFRAPVMLYSGGKDSSVLLHLARKAFYPARPPFPFLHIATGWDFRELLVHRDRTAAAHRLDLLVHGNDEATRAGVNPFTTETGEYSRLMLTEALRQALDRYGFDVAIGGGRRDEEKIARQGARSSRAARRATPGTRATSSRSCGATTTCGSRPGETMRAFPLSNWTEADVWAYIQAESISIVPLYFAADRPGAARAAMPGSRSTTSACTCTPTRRSRPAACASGRSAAGR